MRLRDVCEERRFVSSGKLQMYWTPFREPGWYIDCRRNQHVSCPRAGCRRKHVDRSEEHTSELQSRENLVCRLLLEKKKITRRKTVIRKTLLLTSHHITMPLIFPIVPS